MPKPKSKLSNTQHNKVVIFDDHTPKGSLQISSKHKNVDFLEKRKGGKKNKKQNFDGKEVGEKRGKQWWGYSRGGFQCHVIHVRDSLREVNESMQKPWLSHSESQNKEEGKCLH